MNITKTAIAALPPNSILWDDRVAGFYARRRTSAAVVFGVRRRLDGVIRWFAIGRYGSPWTIEEARTRALEILHAVAQGRDPAAVDADRMTVADLCRKYMAEAEAGRILTRGLPKRASTLAIDRGRIERHLVPLIGAKPAKSLRRAEVASCLKDITDEKTAAVIKTKPRGLARVAGGPGAAKRCITLLGAVYAWAQRNDLVDGNPVRGIQLPPDRRRERRLSDVEYGRLGALLRCAERRAASGELWPSAVALLRFLAVSGWRQSDACRMIWAEVDQERRTAFLSNTKTRASIRPLSRQALAALAAVPKGSPEALVFRSPGGAALDFGFALDEILKLDECVVSDHPPLTRFTSSIFRHSIASLGADIGLSDSIIGEAIGHRVGRSVVSRHYAHPDSGVILAAADRLADETINRMRL